MLDIAMDIRSLSHFKRKSPFAMAPLKVTGYQQLLEQAERAEMIALLIETKAEIDAGKAVLAVKALDALARKQKLSNQSLGESAIAEPFSLTA